MNRFLNYGETTSGFSRVKSQSPMDSPGAEFGHASSVPFGLKEGLSKCWFAGIVASGLPVFVSFNERLFARHIANNAPSGLIVTRELLVARVSMTCRCCSHSTSHRMTWPSSATASALPSVVKETV